MYNQQLQQHGAETWLWFWLLSAWRLQKELIKESSGTSKSRMIRPSRRLWSVAVLVLSTCWSLTMNVEGQRELFSTKSLYGITYSPFDRNPATICLPVRTVEQDMKLIHQIADRVRLYSISTCRANTEAILEFASANGMKVLLGLFMSRNTNLNDAEIDLVLPLMETYSEIIEGVVVGNEVVFAREVSVWWTSENIENANELMMKPWVLLQSTAQHSFFCTAAVAVFLVFYFICVASLNAFCSDFPLEHTHG